MSSILTSIKKLLGITEDFEAYDPDIILYTNMVLANLNQIGVGPDEGFQIEDKSDTWESFLDGDPRLNNVKAYIATKVRLLFDPPPTSFGIDALEKVALELETRIYIAREVEKWQAQVTIVPTPWV